MNITYRMTPNQADAMDRIICACHDNEHDKGGDGYGVDLLDTIWTARCEMVNLQAVAGIVAWTLPRWFPLEMIVEQYGPELERETADGTFVADVYDAVAPLFHGVADATAVIREAILALHENWTEYYGPNGEREDIEPDRIEQFQTLMRLSEQVRTASTIELNVKSSQHRCAYDKEQYDNERQMGEHEESI